MDCYPYIFQDLVDAGILRPVQPSASSGWTKYKIGREFSPGVVPGAVLDLHAERANGGVSPGVNSPPTTTWHDVSGNEHHGTLENFTFEQDCGWASDPARLVVDKDGINSRINYPSGVNNGEAELTIEMRIRKLTVATSGNRYAVMTNFSTGGFMLYTAPNASSFTWAVMAVEGSQYLTAYPDGLDIWRQVALTIDASGLQAWLDGVAYGAKRLCTYVPATSTILRLFNNYNAPMLGDCSLVRYYNRALSAAEIAQNYAASPEWDKRTPSSLTIPLNLGNTAWTVAGRYSGLWPHDDALLHNLLTLRSGEDNRATIYKHTDNKLYASVNDGVDTAVSASAAQTLAPDTVNTFVARATWGSTVDLSINGVPSTQGDASLVGAQTIDSLVIGGGPSGSIGPLIISSTNKGANWQAAVEATGLNDPFRLVRDYMAVGDYIVPFGYSSTAYRKVR